MHCFLLFIDVISNYICNFVQNMTILNKESPHYFVKIWSKENLPKENGEVVPMQVPMIISASRSRKIPIF